MRPSTGFGAFWARVQTHVFFFPTKLARLRRVVTDGSVRDLEAMAPDFLVLAGDHAVARPCPPRSITAAGQRRRK